MAFQLNNEKIKVHRISPGNPVVASGGFGQVSIALGIKTEPDKAHFSINYVAIKEIRRAITLKHFEPEHYSFTRAAFCELAALRLLSQYHHPCITPLLSIIESDRDPYSLSLVFPYGILDLRTMTEYRRRSLNFRTKFVPESMLKTIMGDVLSALQFCHSKGIMHRDVTPSNCIITSDGHIQLSDFGLAKAWEAKCSSLEQLLPNQKEISDLNGDIDCTSRPRSNAQCTLYYRAPEILFNADNYGFEVDIWSCGLLLAELINLCPLFPGRVTLDQIARIFHVLGTPHKNNWPEADTFEDFRKFCFQPQTGCGLERMIPRLTLFHSSLSEILTSTLSLDPKKRPTAAQCQSHSWFSALPSASSRSDLCDSLIPMNLRIPRTCLDFVPFQEEQNLSSVLEFHRERALDVARRRRGV